MRWNRDNLLLPKSKGNLHMPRYSKSKVIKTSCFVSFNNVSIDNVFGGKDVSVNWVVVFIVFEKFSKVILNMNDLNIQTNVFPKHSFLFLKLSSQSTKILDRKAIFDELGGFLSCFGLMIVQGIRKRI